MRRILYLIVFSVIFASVSPAGEERSPHSLGDEA